VVIEDQDPAKVHGASAIDIISWVFGSPRRRPPRPARSAREQAMDASPSEQILGQRAIVVSACRSGVLRGPGTARREAATRRPAGRRGAAPSINVEGRRGAAVILGSQNGAFWFSRMDAGAAGR